MRGKGEVFSVIVTLRVCIRVSRSGLKRSLFKLRIILVIHGFVNVDEFGNHCLRLKAAECVSGKVEGNILDSAS